MGWPCGRASVACPQATPRADPLMHRAAGHAARPGPAVARAWAALDVAVPRVEHRAMSVVLRPISRSAAEALLAGDTPDDVRVADDHPTEFSAGIAENMGEGSALGPFFLHRTDDDVVVGEIGAGFSGPGTVEIGYAVVGSCQGRGYATDAVRELVGRLRGVAGI